MKRFRNYCTSLLLVAVACFAVSCDDNEEIKVDPNTEFDAILDVKEGGAANPNVNVVVDANTTSIIDAKVSFTSTTKSMKRLYITRNVAGAGEEKFEPTENIDLKGDGAVDLEGGDDKSFNYHFKLPVPSGVSTGTVVYKFWTTSGNGDFRDQTQRLAVGPGTITLTYGAGTNPATGTYDVKTYSDVKLSAPLEDGSSKTFVSLLDGKTYNVSQGIEYVSLWDFGYLYSNTDGATLRAPYNYNVPYYPGVLTKAIIDIPTLANTTNDELNKIYLKKSSKLAADFDAVKINSNLDFVSVVQNNDNIRVTGLVADNVVEFIDQYGKKGLIKVLEVSGGQGTGGYIRIAIKVQR